MSNRRSVRQHQNLPATFHLGPSLENWRRRVSLSQMQQDRAVSRARLSASTTEIHLVQCFPHRQYSILIPTLSIAATCSLLLPLPHELRHGHENAHPPHRTSVSQSGVSLCPVRFTFVRRCNAALSSHGSARCQGSATSVPRMRRLLHVLHAPDQPSVQPPRGDEPPNEDRRERIAIQIVDETEIVAVRGDQAGQDRRGQCMQKHRDQIVEQGNGPFGDCQLNGRDRPASFVFAFDFFSVILFYNCQISLFLAKQPLGVITSFIYLFSALSSRCACCFFLFERKKRCSCDCCYSDCLVSRILLVHRCCFSSDRKRRRQTNTTGSRA